MTREKELKELKFREPRKVVVVRKVGLRSKCKCRTCKEELDDLDRFAFCPYCGQKLDWSVLDDWGNSRIRRWIRAGGSCD